MRKTLLKIVALALVFCSFAVAFLVGCGETKSYSVTIESASGGTVVADKDSYASGEQVKLTVTPKNCYELSSLIVDGNDVTKDLSGNEYKYVINEDSTVSAKFKRVKWTLTIAEYNVSYGSVTTSDGASEYALGASVTLNVLAYEGYKYSSVVLNGSDITTAVRNANGRYTFNITQNTVVNVTFTVKNKYSVKASGIVAIQGSVVISPSKPEYNKNDAVTVSIIANEGYKVSKVKLNDTDVTSSLNDGSFTFNVEDDSVITVEYEPTIKYTVTVNYDSAKMTVSLTNQKSEYCHNETTTLVVDVKEGYLLTAATFNDSDVRSSFKNIGGSYEVTVKQNVRIDLSVQKESLDIVETTVDSFENDIDRKGKILLDFWADDCSVCTGTLAPMLTKFANNAKNGNELESSINLKIIKVRVGSSRSLTAGTTTPELKIFNQYKTYYNGTFPYMVIIEDGEVIGAINGTYNDYSTLVDWFKNPTFAG